MAISTLHLSTLFYIIFPLCVLGDPEYSGLSPNYITNLRTYTEIHREDTEIHRDLIS